MKRIFFIFAILALLFFPPPVSATLFDNCDNLNPPNGAWNICDDYCGNLGSNITLEYSEKVEGNASIKAYLTGNSWYTFFYKRRQPGQWDFSNEPILKFRLYPLQSIPVTGTTRLYLDLVTGEPDGWGWNSHQYNLPELIPNQWNEIEIDLRIDANGNSVSDLALSKGVQLSLTFSNHYGSSYIFYLDWIETLPASTQRGTLEVHAYAGSSEVATPVNISRVGIFITPVNINLFEGNYTLTIKYGSQSSTRNVSIISGQVTRADFQFIPEFKPIKKLHIEGRYIKDEDEDVIYLRGINQPGFLDSPSGWWTNIDVWEPDEIRAHLKSMKSWGMNAVRLMTTVGWWIDNNITWRGVNYPSYRQNIKTAVEIAREEGLYVIFVPWNILGYSPQVACPFPPYISDEEKVYIPTKQAFVEYWKNVTNELKDYPNVIFELWNEPVCSNVTEWLEMAQKIINEVRQITDHIIMVHYGYCGGFNWVEQYPLNGTNILYSNHIYRYHGTYGSPNNPSTPETDYQYDDLKNWLIYWGYKHLIEDLGLPIIVGEVGPLGSDITHELIAYENTLKILNEWEISYTSWWWRPDGTAAHIDSRRTRNPNTAGQILINAISEGGTYAVNFSSEIKDKNNNPVKVNLSLTKDNAIAYNLTNVNKFSLIIKPSFYDIVYNLTEFWLIMIKTNLTYSKSYNKLNSITLYPDKNSLIFDTIQNQTILVYSKEKPKSILKNGIPLRECTSLADLTDNYGWFYNKSQKIVYIKFNETVG